MLKLAPHYVFTTQAEIALNGLQARFGVHCRLLPLDELLALQERQAKGEINGEQFINAWLHGWAEDEVRGADDAPLPFTPENLARLLNVPGAPLALIRAFYAGYDEAVEKNSAPLPAGS